MRRAASYLVVAVASAVVTYGLAGLGHRPPPGVQAAPPQAAPPQPAGPAALAPELLEASPEERINVALYQQTNRSVVNITTRGAQADDFLSLFGPREGSGSGSVLDKQGHILTNHHVVGDDARQITVTLSDSSVHEARLVGSDPNNDLAVLKVNAPAELLFPIAWGDSSKLLVGMRVFALGNPFGLDRTLTTGIVSSLNRSLRTENRRLVRGIIQTDAAINPGNSGGPLLNRRGQMVGITTAIISPAGQNSGIGLAISANTARRVVDELIRNGRVIRPECGIVGVYETERGLLVAQLNPDGPAAKAGLRGPKETVVRRFGFAYRTVDRSKADLILAVDGKRVKSLDDLLSYVESKKAGDRVVLHVVREGEKQEVPVTLEETPGRDR
jgi:S1-C subfamily serine protease